MPEQKTRTTQLVFNLLFKYEITFVYLIGKVPNPASQRKQF